MNKPANVEGAALSGIKHARAALDSVVGNIVDAKVAGAVKRQAHYTKDANGTVNLEILRQNNKNYTDIQLRNIADAAQHNQTKSFISEIQQIDAEGVDAYESAVVNNLNDFLSYTDSLLTENNASTRRTFVDKAHILANTINKAIDKCDSLIQKIDNDFSTRIVRLNSDIKSLFEVNNTVPNDDRLHDKRDALIRDIAESFTVNVSSSAQNGSISVTAPGYSHIVSFDGYVQFEYKIPKESFDNKPALFLNWTDLNGNKSESRGGAAERDILPSFTGGAFESFYKLKTDIVPNIRDSIKAYSNNLTMQVNQIHNDGVSLNPSGILTSKLDVSYDQSLKWGEEFSVYAIDRNGDSLSGGAGLVHAAKIDMQNIKTTASGGRATVADLIKELNAKLETAPSAPRVAIGDIFTEDAGVNVQVEGEYLLNNVNLLAHQAIGADNQLVFELELQGNARFGSTVKIHQAYTQNIGGGAATQTSVSELPDDFELAVGENTATNQTIVVNDATAGRVVTLDIEVIGENGIRNRGQVSFGINANIITNQRMYFDPSLAHLPTDDFLHPGVTLEAHPSIARAMLVDANGKEINAADIYTAGKLMIQTSNVDYRLAIQGGNFASQLGFHNFFDHDQKTGKISLNPVIAKDHSKINFGRVRKDAGSQVPHVVGQATAEANVTFSGGFTAGSVVDIDPYNSVIPVNNGPNSVRFNFVAGLSNSVTDVSLMGSPMQNLIDKMNDHPDLKSVITVNALGGTGMQIVAKQAGSSGNRMTVATTLLGAMQALIVPYQAVPGLPMTNNNATALAGGEDTQLEVSIFNHSVKSGNVGIAKELGDLRTTTFLVMSGGDIKAQQMSLSTLAGFVSGAITDRYNDFDQKHSVSQARLEMINQKIYKETGINTEDQFRESLDWRYQLEAISKMWHLSTKARSDLLNLVTRATG